MRACDSESREILREAFEQCWWIHKQAMLAPNICDVEAPLNSNGGESYLGGMGMTDAVEKSIRKKAGFTVRSPLGARRAAFPGSRPPPSLRRTSSGPCSSSALAFVLMAAT